MRALGIRRARRLAEALLNRWCVIHPADIDVARFAREFGAHVFDAPLASAKARLTQAGDSIWIAIADSTYDDFDRRFSIAHELGHVALEHPSPAPRDVLVPRPRAGIELPATWEPSAIHAPLLEAGAERSHEAEADAFAIELLLPPALVAPACDVSPMSLDVAFRIAQSYKVSIPAATLRVIELTSERCAAVLAVDGMVRWTAQSKSLSLPIRAGPRLRRGSLAYAYFARGKGLDTPQEVSARAWFRTRRRVPIVEHTISAPGHRATLSMLWIPERSATRLRIE